MPVIAAKNDRVQGWYNLKEWLSPFRDETGEMCAYLRVFSNCINLIRTLPAIGVDSKNPNDVANTPHELTHAPDAIRYFVAGRPVPGISPKEEITDTPEFDEQIESLLEFS